MTLDLRPYQKECLEILPLHNKQLIHLPTGSGKTIIFLKYLSTNSQQAIVVVPTLDLQEQVYENSMRFFHKDDVVRKSDFKDQKFRLLIVIAASLNEKFLQSILQHKIDHIVIDECHRALANTYLKFLESFRKYNNNFKLIGFTATPERHDKKSLMSIFEKISYKKSIVELIQEGFLCNIRCYRIKTNHAIKSDSKSNDFRTIELKCLDNYSRNSLIYTCIIENCFEKKTLIFCLSVDHAEKIATYLRKEKGMKAAHISGRESPENRKKILNDFKTGEIQILTNCQLLTEGFDEPSIETLIIARPTKSKSLYCQMIGRGSRLFPNKNICNVYELTDNNHRICTFNVVADEEKDERFSRDYRQGITLTDLHKEISEISLSEYVLEKTEITIISNLRDFLESKKIIDLQKKKLDLEPHASFIDQINFFQASFLIFIENLKVKYGFN